MRTREKKRMVGEYAQEDGFRHSIWTQITRVFSFNPLIHESIFKYWGISIMKFCINGMADPQGLATSRG